MSGFLSGASFIFLLVLMPLYLNRGDEIKSTKTFGNVKITPFEVDDKILFSTGESLIIQKDQEPILSLYFDYNKKLTELSFLHENKPLFSAYLHPDLNKWGGFSFGYYESGISYYDKNCDAFFDDMDVIRARTSYIFIDNQWLKVDEKKGFRATIGSGSSMHEYIFSLEKGWVEKTPERTNNPDPNDAQN